MTAFTFWMGACIPTSAWRGGSFAVFKDYVLNDFMIFGAIACVASVLFAQKRIVHAMAFVVPVFILIVAGASTQSAYGERTMIQYGTYGNPNSIASHLLFLSPFVICSMLLRKGFSISRAAGFLVLFAGFVFFVRTGSRGGVLALLIMLAAVFLSLPISRKAVAVLLLIVAVPLSLTLIPKDALLRYRTIFSQASPLEANDEDAKTLNAAIASSSLRKLLFWESVAISFRHPIFGVGPGQFDVYKANEAEAAGQHANWLVTHNAYTQVSSEMGLVGFVFYMGLLLTTGLTLRRIRKRFRQVPHMRPAYYIASSLLMSWLAYCVFSVFDYVAYYQYVPLLAGFAVGLNNAVTNEMENGKVVDGAMGASAI